MKNKENKRVVTSAVLAKALNDIGANNETIQLRRTMWLNIEALHTINQKAKDENVDVYKFGSQSEGTTTVGMHSDIDFLICDRELTVIQDSADCQFGRAQLFVVTDRPSVAICNA
ncbi:hypothetical protein DPMN_079085 [Dreissena polymorpha]|uniref:Uncharacterized protein n=1 Tax=Dreissena polymorpha TaxID=45954 RepID=A0A9D3YSF5_DREPO|nr:hypothetical protein DPMN_079085 [Dreissena polymorpha]